VRTTLDLDDALYREVKILAAERRVTATSLVEEGLREVLNRYRALEPTPLPVLPELASLRPGIDVNNGSALRALLDGAASADADLP
jgi:hypothetical protein